MCLVHKSDILKHSLFSTTKFNVYFKPRKSISVTLEPPSSRAEHKFRGFTEHQGVGVVVVNASGFKTLHTDVCWEILLFSAVDPHKLPVTYPFCPTGTFRPHDSLCCVCT